MKQILTSCCETEIYYSTRAMLEERRRVALKKRQTAKTPEREAMFDDSINSIDSAIECMDALANRINVAINSSMSVIEVQSEKINRLESRVRALGLVKRAYEISMSELGITGNGITTDLLKKLKQLCHPDRHGNSELSNSVSSELNKMNK